MKKATLITLEILACLAVAWLFWLAISSPVAAQICPEGQIWVCYWLGDVQYCYCY